MYKLKDILNEKTILKLVRMAYNTHTYKERKIRKLTTEEVERLLRYIQQKRKH